MVQSGHTAVVVAYLVLVETCHAQLDFLTPERVHASKSRRILRFKTCPG